VGNPIQSWHGNWFDTAEALVSFDQLPLVEQGSAASLQGVPASGLANVSDFGSHLQFTLTSGFDQNLDLGVSGQAVDATAVAAGTAGASAAAIVSVTALAQYLAVSSPTSSGGHRFASSAITVNLTGLALAGEIIYARAALAAWSQVANINFVETTVGGQICIFDDGDNINYDAYASGGSLNTQGFLSSSEIHITQAWYNNNGGAGGAVNTLHSYGYQTYVHEIGHALGLGHLGPYNGSATYGTNAIFANDSWQYSVMSYFSQAENTDPTLRASYSYISSAMQADIVAIQMLYGAPLARTRGHTFGYGAARDTGAAFNLAIVDSFTMYSSDGYAILDASGFGGAQTVSFNSGTFSSIKGLTDNISLASSTHLTGYTGGAGIDTIEMGGSSNGARYANGGAGNDLFMATGGSSSTAIVTVDGGTGVDVFKSALARNSITLFAHTSQSNNCWTVIGANDYENLSNVETYRFSDYDVTLRQSRSNFNFCAANDLGASSDLLLQSGSLVVSWTMQGGRYSAGATLSTSATGYSVVGTGDFNADGTSDIVLQNGGIVVAWTMQNGAYQSGRVLSTSSMGYSVVGTGDFNNDGTQDILLQNGGTIVSWTMQNGAYGSGRVLGAGVTGYSVVGTGDFNGDGTADVLLQNGNTIVEWFMSNGGVSSTRVLTSTAGGYTVRGTGDFNGDGTTDILLQNGGNVVDWIMSAGNFSQGNTLATSLTGYEVRAVGDYNGDGTADIILQNGGMVVDWIISNGRYTAGNVLSSSVTGWSIAA
jgi:serralysin